MSFGTRSSAVIAEYMVKREVYNSHVPLTRLVPSSRAMSFVEGSYLDCRKDSWPGRILSRVADKPLRLLGAHLAHHHHLGPGLHDRSLTPSSAHPRRPNSLWSLEG